MSWLSRVANLALAKQAIKTAVAGVVCLYVTQILRLPEGYWAAITALIVMQSSVGATVSASRTRLAGTAVGALVGGAFFAAFGSSIPWFAAAAAIAFYVCSVLGLAESQRLATVTVAIVMLIGRADSPWLIAWHRFLEVAIGILITLLVSLVLWPSRARRSLRQGIAETLGNLKTLCQAVSSGFRNGVAPATQGLKDAVDAGLRRDQDLLQQAVRETVGLTRGPEVLALLVNRIEGITQAVESLELALQGASNDAYVHAFDAELDRVETGLSAAFEWLAENISSKNPRRTEPIRGWPPLKASVADLERRMAEARKTGATAAHPLDEISRFYSFFLSLKTLAEELDRTRAFVDSALRQAAGH